MIVLLALLLAPLDVTDARSALELLNASTAAERQTGERWLASHLSPEDFSVVAETLLEGDLELRRRVGNALSTGERHLALSALCAADPVEVVSEVGLSALASQFGRWLGDFDGSSVAGTALWHRLDGMHQGTLRLELGRLDLDQAIDRLVRAARGKDELYAGRLPLHVALSPSIYAEVLESPSAAPEFLEGPWESLLVRSAGARGARVEAFGLDGPNAWLHVSKRSEHRRFQGAELAARWCRELLRYPDRPLGAGAARALAATGWPAAISWLERRWTLSGDENALTGLLLAAGRGRVASVFSMPEVFAALLDRADRAIATGTPEGLAEAGAIQRALTGVAPTLPPTALSLAERLAGEGTPRTPASVWMRLSILAGLREQVSPALLGTDAAARDPRVRWLLLRANAEAGAPLDATELGDPAELLRLADTRGAAFETLTWLVACGLEPPPAGDSAGVRPLLAFLWWWMREEPARAAPYLVRAAGEVDGPVFGTELARFVRRAARVGRALSFGEVLGQALQRSGAGPARETLLELGLVAGALPTELRDDLEERAESARDGALLGELAAHPRGGGARAALLEWLKTELASPGRSPKAELEPELLDGLERALLGLEARSPKGHQALADSIGEALREADHPLLFGLASGAWPARRDEARRIETQDWYLEDLF